MHVETESASSERDVCVVGAGIAGLLAAHVLQQAGLSVRVLEKESSPGGRMGQTILPLPDGRTARFDRGCQFFTAHDPLFTEITEQWLAAGLLREWGLGHISGLDARSEPHHVRLIGNGPVCKPLLQVAEGLDLRCGESVERLTREDETWIVETASKLRVTAQALVIAIPLPSALALLADSGLAMESHERSMLGRIEYRPCLTLLAAFDAPSRIPEPGGLNVELPSLFWLADNRMKGLSDVTAITAHAREEFAASVATRSREETIEILIKEIEPWTQGLPLATDMLAWTHAFVKNPHHRMCMLPQGLPNLLMVGDGFGAPRVEGAALSGIFGARKLLQQLDVPATC